MGMSQVSEIPPYYPALASKSPVKTSDYSSRHPFQSNLDSNYNGIKPGSKALAMAFGDIDEGMSTTSFVRPEGANEGSNHNWVEWLSKCPEHAFNLSQGMPAIMPEEPLTTQIPSDQSISEEFVAHANGNHAFTWIPSSYFLLGGDQLLARGRDDDENATMIPITSMQTGIQLDNTSYLAFGHCYPSSYAGLPFLSAPNTPEFMEYPESTISPRTLQRYTDQHTNDGYQSGSETYSLAGGYETADSRGSTPGHGGLYEYRSYHDPSLTTTEIKTETEEEYSNLHKRKGDSIEPSLQDNTMQRQKLRLEDMGSPHYYQSELQYDSHAQSKREEENALLKFYRESNMSYKQIRAKFDFRYTESTLRGRWRTISKPRGQRVRKPKWYGNDVRLLDEAVKATPQPHDLSTVKWKEIAEQIVRRGGSYRFGVTTCKKKYLDVLNRGLETVVKECGADHPPSNMGNSMHC